MLGTPAPNFTLRSTPDQMVSLEEFHNLKQRISLMARVLFPRRARESDPQNAQRHCKEDKVQVVVFSMVDIDSVSYSHPYFILEEDTGGGGECPLIRFRGVVYAQK
jgi:hypothetical protein